MTLRGCGTALVTPFRDDGSVDYEAYARLVDRQVAGGADFLVPLATTAETPTLSVEERRELLRITDARSGGLPLLVGCGSNSVPGTLACVEALQGLRADAWLVVVPFYNKPTQEGQYRYFKTIAESLPGPVVIYNVPGRTGADMLPETCLRLAREVPGIIGIKEASGRIDRVKEILAGAPEGFSLFSGDDDLTLDMIEAGAAGAVSVASNVRPSEISEVIRTALAGDFAAARRMDKALQPLYKACFVEPNPIPVKAALSILGLCRPAMRLPLVEASPSTVGLLESVLSEEIRN